MNAKFELEENWEEGFINFYLLDAWFNYNGKTNLN